MCIVIVSALLLVVCIRAPDVWKLPCDATIQSSILYSRAGRARGSAVLASASHKVPWSVSAAYVQFV